MQPASFTLATLAFTSLAVGSSPLTFTQSIVDDALAVRLDLAAADGRVDVVAPPGGTVPVPATLVLLASGLAAWAGTRGRATAPAG